MTNQTAQIAGGKKLKLEVFRGTLALSGNDISLDISRQVWHSKVLSHCRANYNVLSFSYVEISGNEMYIRGKEDFSDEEYEKRIRESERTCRFYDNAAQKFIYHKENLHDAATWVAESFMKRFK